LYKSLSERWAFAKMVGVKVKKFTNIGNMEDVIVIPRARLRAAGRKRWKGVPKSDRRKIASAAGNAFWAKLTPEERSLEMKRRAKIRTRKRRRTQG
jgi:hypothetical protein